MYTKKQQKEGIAHEKTLRLCAATLMLAGALSGCGRTTAADTAATSADTAAATGETVAAPYAGTLSDAEVLIRLPNLRQYGDYTCGTTCVQMILNWLYPQTGDINLRDIEAALGTTEADGTPPERIVAYLEERGVTFTAAQDRTTDEIVAALDKGHPMMLCLQAWNQPGEPYNTTDPADADTYLNAGHWLICVGYAETGDGYCFYFNDPACVGYCLLAESELEPRWIDRVSGGDPCPHYGIEIEGDTPYNHEGVYHLD